MVKVEVFGNVKATCTQKVLILLEELDIKYDIKNIDLLKGEQKTPEFLELQPFGKIPVVNYGDRTLFESRSILRYIAKNNTEIVDLLGDADVDIWLEVESQYYNSPVSKIVYEKVFKKLYGDDQVDEEVVKTAVEELEKILDIYEQRLLNQNFIGGDTFSIADISHIPYTNHLLRCGYKELFKSRPNVYKWLKRIIKRDSVQYILSEAK